MLLDAHCHLGFMADARDAAASLHDAGVLVADVTVEPAAFASDAERFAAFPHVVVGAGLHPWWAPGAPGDGRLEALLDAVGRTPFVGEVGLDFGARRAAGADDQLAVFRAVADACGREGGKTLSIHAVRSAGAALDVLETSGCLEACTCVFHWFSGTSEELARAVRAGCFFSVGEPMLRTRRGRAYARSIPRGRLLLETDAPPTHVGASAPAEGEGRPAVPPVPSDVPYGADDLAASLRRALEGIASARAGASAAPRGAAEPVAVAEEALEELAAALEGNARRAFPLFAQR